MKGRSTGISKVLKADDAHSLFDATGDYMKVVVGKASVKVTGSVGKTSGKTSGKILAVIRNNRNVTIVELSELAGVTTRSVERNLKKL